MARLRIGLLQLTPSGDLEQNRLKGSESCRWARASGADIALFPEMWSCGYDFFLPQGAESWKDSAIERDSAFVRSFRSLAQELDMAIGLTILETWPGRPRNTLLLIDRHGEIILVYAKVHTCEFDHEKALSPGDSFPVATLDTAVGPVQIGAMICYDREFPESARLLMLGGAEIILTPNACDLEMNRLAQLRGRAYENMTGIAVTNYPAPYNNGHSVAYTGIAFGMAEGESLDMVIVEAGKDPGIAIADFDLTGLRRYRQKECQADTYRRPRLYDALCSNTVLPVFQREDATR